jgi:hypothetical protein
MEVRGRKVSEYWSKGFGGNISICGVDCEINIVSYGR